LSGRMRSYDNTPRGRVRPDRVGREGPPSERVRDRLRGWQRGSLTPHITLTFHPRGLRGGEERRLIISYEGGVGGQRECGGTAEHRQLGEFNRSRRSERGVQAPC
jgi:hypothetical protein